MVVYVVAQGPYVGQRLSTGLSSRGAKVALLGDTAAGTDVIVTDFNSLATIQEAFTKATRSVGSPQLVIVSALPRCAVVASPIARTQDSDWQSACRDVIRTTLHCLQAANKSLPEAGNIIVLGPAFTFSGSADLVALSTASEAQRGLVKSAARQWGERGIRLNWIGISATQLTEDFADARLPFRPERLPTTVGHALDVEREIVPIIDFLATPAGRNMSGASLCLDGGEWLVP